METFKRVIGLFVVAVTLAAVARRVGAPYPVFLALGGAVLAILPVEVSSVSSMELQPIYDRRPISSFSAEPRGIRQRAHQR